MHAQVVESLFEGCGLGELVVVVDLERTWDAAEVVQAVKGLVRAFPILGCRFERHWWRSRWAPVEEPVEGLVRVRESEDLEADTDRVASERIDVYRTRPLRVTLLTQGRRSRLVLNMPHLVADGNGVLTTLRELAAQLMGTGRTEPVPMDRSVWQLARALGWSQAPAALAELGRELQRQVAMPQVRPWADGLTPGTPREVDPMRLVRLTEEQSRDFQVLCRTRGATVNDGLVAAALCVASEQLDGGLAATSYTVNLRRFLSNPGPIVANLSGFSMVAVPAEAARRPANILPQVATITGEQKSRLPGVGALLLPLALVGWVNHGLASLGGRVFRAMVDKQTRRLLVMTNVGVMDPYLEPFGDWVMDAWMVPPKVRKMRVPISLATSFRGRLAVCVGGERELTLEPVEAVAQRWQRAFERMLADAEVPGTESALPRRAAEA
jgi:NRPS condensation-like uncharacterized protein